MSRVGGALIVMVVVIAVVLVMRAHTGAEKPPEQVAEAFSKHFATAPKGSLTPEAVLAIAPRSRELAAQRVARPLSPGVRELESAKSYAAIYARLKASASRTPEEQWMLAEILQRCARNADEPERARRPPQLGTPEARARFMAALAPGDPDRERRIAAFEQVNFDDCEGLREVQTTRTEIRALLEAGAAGGDPKARVRLVGAQIEDQVRGPDGKEIPGAVPSIGDAQLETLRQAFASGDVAAVRAAVALLALDYQNMSLRDRDDRPLDAMALLRATALLNCDNGAPCGADSPYLAHFCALNGQCAANSLRDFVMFYGASPASSQLIATYEDGLRRARDNNDWSFFHFYPGPLPETAAFQAPPGP